MSFQEKENGADRAFRLLNEKLDRIARRIDVIDERDKIIAGLLDEIIGSHGSANQSPEEPIGDNVPTPSAEIEIEQDAPQELSEKDRLKKKVLRRIRREWITSSELAPLFDLKVDQMKHIVKLLFEDDLLERKIIHGQKARCPSYAYRKVKRKKKEVI